MANANKRTDIGQVEKSADGQKPGQHGDETADEDGTFPGSPKHRMNVGEKRSGDQTVAGHGHENARALSIMTRSTEVMPATPAAAMMNSAQGKPFCENAMATPAFSSISR